MAMLHKGNINGKAMVIYINNHSLIIESNKKLYRKKIAKKKKRD
jgi:hypothetical protein